MSLADSHPAEASEDLTDPDFKATFQERRTPHICVCICTFKRPIMLRRLLTEVDKQITNGLFSYSVSVADNDQKQSAAAVIAAFSSTTNLRIKYSAEPKQGIALARNMVVENSEGEYVAFIDDDEFPCSTWLLNLYKTCIEYNVDGVLGPVRRHFDEVPPAWLQKSRFFDRQVNPTGVMVDWREARTGNVLLKRKLLLRDSVPFRPELRSGEDVDFFRRKTEEGSRFVWCAEAEAYEVVPPARWKRTYLMRRALLRGACAGLRPECGPVSVGKSVLAVPMYAVMLPFALLLGQDKFMTLLVKLCDHSGKLLALMGVNPVSGEYVSE